MGAFFPGSEGPLAMLAPIVGAQPDHTYVTSDEGHTWPCPARARSSGGRSIATEAGSAEIADCLSRPDSTADIRYLVTGVCHQMANRILHPAGVDVVGAVGYEYSVIVWEVWGLGAWPALRECYGADEEPAAPDDSRTVGGDGGAPVMTRDDSKRQFSRRVRAVYESLVRPSKDSGPTPEASAAVLQALFDSFLGKDYDSEKRQKVAALRAELRNRQRDLATKLEVGSVGAEEYYKLLNDQILTTFRECEKVLGASDFRQIFGGPPEGAIAIYSRETFLKSRKA